MDSALVYALSFFHILDKPVNSDKEGRMMKERMEYIRRRRLYRSCFLYFLIGILAGILFMYCMGYGAAGQGELFKKNVLLALSYGNLDKGKYLQYELPRRLKPAVLLLVLSTTAFGFLAVRFYTVMKGFFAGLLLSGTVLTYGIKGGLLLIVLLFPHQLLLMPALFLLLCFCYQVCCILQAPEGCIWPVYTGRKKQLISLLLILLWILFITVAGCLLECYVNPLLVADAVRLLL